MREKLGVFLMEEPGGGVSVQLFASQDELKKLFANLTGKPGDKPARATALYLEWQLDSVRVLSQSRELPVPDPDPEKVPDGIRLGEGPFFLPKPEEPIK